MSLASEIRHTHFTRFRFRICPLVIGPCTSILHYSQVLMCEKVPIFIFILFDWPLVLSRNWLGSGTDTWTPQGVLGDREIFWPLCWKFSGELQLGATELPKKFCYYPESPELSGWNVGLGELSSFKQRIWRDFVNRLMVGKSASNVVKNKLLGSIGHSSHYLGPVLM